MEHVKPMKVYNSRGHCVDAQAHSIATLHDESGPFFAVAPFSLIV